MYHVRRCPIYNFHDMHLASDTINTTIPTKRDMPTTYIAPSVCIDGYFIGNTAVNIEGRFITQKHKGLSVILRRFMAFHDMNLICLGMPSFIVSISLFENNPSTLCRIHCGLMSNKLSFILSRVCLRCS